MNILVIGSGGREHALAWAIAGSPLADKVYCAPGNAGIAEDAECVPIAATDTRRHRRFLPPQPDRFRRRRTGGAARRRPRRCARSRGHRRVRPQRRRRRARRLEILHEGSVRARGHPDRRLSPVPRRRARQKPISPRTARRSSSRPTGSPPAKASSSPPRSPRRTTAVDAALGAGTVRRGRRRDRRRGFSRGRGGELFRAGRRRDRAAARRGAGPQAGLRRRHRPEYRRHGRLFAGPSRHAGSRRRASWSGSSCRRCGRWRATGGRSRACSMPG